MNKLGHFAEDTGRTALLAVREYFSPLCVVGGFVRSFLAPARAARSAAAEHITPHQARTLLKERLARRRGLERELLLVLVVLSALMSMLAVILLAIQQLDGLGAVSVAGEVVLGAASVYAIIELIRNRAGIVTLKTLRWVMKSVDQETAERIAKQLTWGKPQKQPRRGRVSRERR